MVLLLDPTQYDFTLSECLHILFFLGTFTYLVIYHPWLISYVLNYLSIAIYVSCQHSGLHSDLLLCSINDKVFFSGM
jgi:hypothetical protein